MAEAFGYARSVLSSILEPYAQWWIESFHSNRPKRRWLMSKKDMPAARSSSR